MQTIYSTQSLKKVMGQKMQIIFFSLKKKKRVQPILNYFEYNAQRFTNLIP